MNTTNTTPAVSDSARSTPEPWLLDKANNQVAEITHLREERDALEYACRGALACLASGDLTPEMALNRLRAALAKLEASK